MVSYLLYVAIDATQNTGKKTSNIADLIISEVPIPPGILGPNEREYLGDDLKKVNVFHPESSNM
ncbi:MAG: hypothetical protein HGJ94_03595 [Desulfosarcina sp.]|nr:hypothetical protein [Desulfosarcina sp.]MBC2743433.1 hypothetical protein [Desulfosarcina sp.]MBC2766343.1 hypothetical protein [Desulfosarcina sp.]